MAQKVIDPRNRGSTAATIAINPIPLPDETRKYGFVPDLSVCKAGDLILSYSVSSDYLERLIIKSQLAAGLDPEDAKWTHAAVFLYQDFIIEAVPSSGVGTRTLYSDIPDSVLRVRRKPGLSEEQRYKIALCAQRMLGSRYDMRGAFSIGWRAIRYGLWDRHWDPPMRKVVICSKVFFDAHAEITRSLLADCPISDPVMPAHLSATSHASLRSKWRRMLRREICPMTDEAGQLRDPDLYNELSASEKELNDAATQSGLSGAVAYRSADYSWSGGAEGLDDPLLVSE